jgi:hypothetical protein
MTDKFDQPSGWTFLTNHAHVLICLKKEPGLTLRDVSARVGITERAVQRIVADLEEEGYLVREREGRRNSYQLNLNRPLRHGVEQPCTIGDLVDLVLQSSNRPSFVEVPKPAVGSTPAPEGPH